MTTLREAAQQALEAMRCAVPTGKITLYAWDKAMADLDAALAQQAEPAQEPAFHGFMSADGTRVDVCFTPSAPRTDGTYATAYYTAPPQRKPLTEEQIKACEKQAMVNGALPFEQRVFFARAIERAHGIGTEARATLTKPCGSLGEEA